MDTLIIKNTNKFAPSIYFDADSGKFNITGRSILDNSAEFYKPVIDFVLKYKANPCPKTEVNISLEYFNTSSSRCLYELLIIFSEIYKSGKDVLANWYYYEIDEDSLELGHDFQYSTGLPFSYLQEKR